MLGGVAAWSEAGDRQDQSSEKGYHRGRLPLECAKKTVEQSGLTPTKSIVLVRDIGMKKKALHEDIGGDVKTLMDYISDDDVQKAKELIVKAIRGT